MKRTHKSSGWTREACGYGNFIITPTDDSGQRKVAFMSAGSWANLPGDDKARQATNRVVLVEGNPLPQWAIDWLTAANEKSMRRALVNFRAMLDQAEFDEDMRNSASY